MLQKKFEFFILALFSVSFATAVTYEYLDEGVLRKDGNCDIMLTNFGVENTLKNVPVKLSNKVNDLFNITITNLINANIGLNNETVFDSPVDLPKYIKVTQNGVDIETVEFFNYEKEMTNGKFDMRIYNLSTCENLMIKQTFKDEVVTVANRLYYVNKVPSSINNAFDSKLFGPSYSFPFERIHWKINDGVDDLRKTCGIHMKFNVNNRNFVQYNAKDKINAHWQYYLSTDSINSKNCTVSDFAKVLEDNYVDYHYTSDLLGDKYMGYVFKREGHVEVHMDGVIADEDSKYIIEVYQSKCSNEQSESRTSCTITSNEKLEFLEFTKRMFKECMSETIDADANIDWSISSSKAIGSLNKQVINIEKSPKDAKGGFPTSSSNIIKYDESSTENSIAVARFIVTITCGEGTFANEVCQCQACAKHCKKCKDAFTCETCEAGENIEVITINGLKYCLVKKGFFDDPAYDDPKPCKKECSECNDFDSCTVCKDPKAVISDGECVCEHSYMNDDGFCAECGPGCSYCDKENRCIACADESKVPKDGQCN